METEKSIYEGIKSVISVSSFSGGQHCRCCNSEVMDFEDMVNHYIEKHGYRLLHVGSETSFDNWQVKYTAAVLGSEVTLPKKETPILRIESNVLFKDRG